MSVVADNRKRNGGVPAESSRLTDVRFDSSVVLCSLLERCRAGLRTVSTNDMFLELLFNC